jgi:hypothetical protein
MPGERMAMMGFINDLFGKLEEYGGNPLQPTQRLRIDGLPAVPEGFEWLVYRDQTTGTVHVELYDPDPMVCSYGQLDSGDPDDVRAYAQRIYDARFDRYEEKDDDAG